MSGTVLDLDCPPAWPRSLLAYLDEHQTLFLAWETKQGQVSAQEFDKAVHGLREALQPHEILGWHCTRLTDAESDGILCNGMQLPNSDLLVQRIDTLVCNGLITLNVAQRLKLENRAGDENYTGCVCFCFFPPFKAGEHGVGRFFRHWGGEALYVCHENNPVTSSAIASIGLPRIVEAVVPIRSLPIHGNLELSIYRRHLFSRGNHTIKVADYEDCIVFPLPSKNIRCVISFPDPDFYSLTGCREWRDTITLR